MKPVFAFVLVAMIIAAASAAEEKKEKEKEVEKKPIEKVVWPGLYSPWVHTAVRPVQLIHHQPVVYQPAHAWWY